MIVLFVILWLLAPIPLTVLMIVNIVGRNKYKKMYEALRTERDMERLNAKFSAESIPFPEAEKKQEQTVHPVQPQQPADREHTVPAADNVSVQPPEPQIPAYDMDLAAAEKSAPEPVNAPELPYVPEPVYVREKKAKDSGVSSMNIMLILGAVFIIISGLIFATTTWKFLSSGIRAAVILSFSAVFFAASFLAEKKLRLEKTGLLFYTLGSVFLPITLVAAGYFKLFGEWFALGGGGQPLLLALTFAALSAVCVRGSCKYKNAAFPWAGLISFSAAICSAVIQIPCDTAVRALILSVYSIALIFAAELLSKKEWDRLSPIMSQIRTFAAVNTFCLSTASLAAVGMSGDGLLTLLSCVIFSLGFLKNSFAEKNGFTGALPLAVFVTCGLFAAIAPEDLTGYVFSAVAASAVIAVLSFMNILPEKLKTAFKYISGVFAALSLILFGIAAFGGAMGEVTLYTALAYAVFTIEILILSIFRREETVGKIMLYALPAACLMTAGMFSSAAFKGDGCKFYSVMLFLGVTAILQTAFVLIKKARLRTAASDCLFACAAAIASFYLTTELGFAAEKTTLFHVIIILSAAVTLVLPAIFSDEAAMRTFFVCASFIWAGTDAAAYAAVVIGTESAVTLSAMITSAVLVLISLLITFRSSQKSVDTGAAVSAYVITLVYAAAQIAVGKIVSPFLLLLTAMSAVRFFRLKRKSDLSAAILMFVITAGAASSDIFEDITLRESLLFMCGAAAAVYIAALFSEKENGFAKLGEALSRYALCVLNLLCIFVLMFDTAAPVFIAMTALFFLMTVTAFYNSGSTAAAVLPLSFMYFAVSHQLSVYTDGYISYAVILIMLVSAALSYLLHGNAIAEKRDGAVCLDAFFVSRFLGPAAYLSLCICDEEKWLVTFLAAGCLLSMCRKGQLPNTRRWIYTVCSFAPVIAWLTQPFFGVPDIISLELKILPFLLYCLALRFFFRDKTALIDNIIFVVYALAYLVLFFGAVDSGELADGLIIVISSFAMLVFSFAVKQKKWFLLSVIVLVVSTLFMSRSFWTSLAWWAYLLIAGIVLVAIGAANEMKKQAAARNEKTGLEEKITRFMSEWKW